MIYVDLAIFPKGNKMFCHCISDTSTEELHKFAKKIGRKRCWFENKKNGMPHYDLDENFRNIAIENGAVECTRIEIGNLFSKYKEGKLYAV